MMSSCLRRCRAALARTDILYGHITSIFTVKRHRVLWFSTRMYLTTNGEDNLLQWYLTVVSVTVRMESTTCCFVPSNVISLQLWTPKVVTAMKTTNSTLYTNNLGLGPTLKKITPAVREKKKLNTTDLEKRFGQVPILEYKTNFVELSATQEAISCVALCSFPAFYGTRRFITEFAKSCTHPEPYQSSSHHPNLSLQDPS
jgi:hypothetical protein